MYINEGFERALFDVRVLNPFAPSNQKPQMATCYRQHEREKRCKYEQRVREIEHTSFVTLVLSYTEGAGPAATIFLRRLAALVTAPNQSSYSKVMKLLRVRLSFALCKPPLPAYAAADHPRAIQEELTQNLQTLQWLRDKSFLRSPYPIYN